MYFLLEDRIYLPVLLFSLEHRCFNCPYRWWFVCRNISIEKGTPPNLDMSRYVSTDYDLLEIIDSFKKTSKGKGVIVNLINRGKRETIEY